MLKAADPRSHRMVARSSETPSIRRTLAGLHRYRALIRNLLATCIHACEICEAECVKHDMDHCRRCAQMCRECAEDCREALLTLNEEVHEEA